MFWTPLGQESVPNREVPPHFRGQNVHNPNVIQWNLSCFRHPWDKKMSLIERCPHFRCQNVHNPNVIQWNLSCFGHPWDKKMSLIERCPHFRSQNVHNPNVIQWNLSCFGHPWDKKVSLIERCPLISGVKMYPILEAATTPTAMSPPLPYDVMALREALHTERGERSTPESGGAIWSSRIV